MPRNHRRNHKIAIGISVFTVLCMLGCNRYTPNKTVVPKEELASYNPSNFGDKSKSSRVVNSIKNEDEFIVKAIWYEEQKKYEQARAYYSKLYQLTKREEYLKKELQTALYTKNSSKNIPKLEAYIERKPLNIELTRILLSSYLKEKNYAKAKVVSQKLSSISTQPRDYELSANAYIYTKDFNEALNLLNKSYDKTFNETTLLKITAIKGSYLQNVEGAIQDLERHITTHGCSERICLQLLDVYVQQRKVDKIISLYEKLYASTHKDGYGEKLVEMYLYRKEYQKAINLLTKDYKNEELLYAIYIEKKEYTHANLLAEILLSKTKNPKWYAESAMTIYEGATDKKNKKMLEEVVSKFDKAISNGVESGIYLNYYGYTLIDNDLDIKKGLKIIQKALSKEPENSYYLDSLAWGYYKNGSCDKAYSIMKKVVDIEGLDEPELMEHWSAIQGKCKK